MAAARGSMVSSPLIHTPVCAPVLPVRTRTRRLLSTCSAIFGVSSLNPLFFTLGLKPDVRAMLARDNPVAEQLLPPSSYARNLPPRSPRKTRQCNHAPAVQGQVRDKCHGGDYCNLSRLVPAG